MKESVLTTKIMKAIRGKYGAEVFLFKVHGSAYQQAGLPDIVGCFRGRLFGFEVKVKPTGYGATPLQLETLQAIRNAGGIACVVYDAEQALMVLASQEKRR